MDTHLTANAPDPLSKGGYDTMRQSHGKYARGEANSAEGLNDQVR